MRKLLKINLLILAFLLIVINIISYFIIDLFDRRNHQKGSKMPAIINENYFEIKAEFSQLETEYKPFIGWSRKPIKKKFTNIDSSGNRATVNQNINSDRVIRFFGGSTMWGTGVDDFNTIPSLFDKCSNKNEIINHGESGFNARQNLEVLINLIQKNKYTDIAVFYDGVNDVEHLCRKQIIIPGHGREVQMRNELSTINSTQSYFKGKDSIFGLSKNLISKLFFKNTVRLIQKVFGKFTKVEQVSPYCCHSNPKRAQAVAMNLLNSWRITHQLASANNIKFIAILQPNAFLGNVKKDYLHLEQKEPLGINFSEVYKILRKEIVAYDWIYDFTEIFDNENKALYFDFCHVNEYGNELIAAHICKVINELE